MLHGNASCTITKSKAVYDARLVAIMNVYAVESILSFNSADFKRYGLVTAVHPAFLIA